MSSPQSKPHSQNISQIVISVVASLVFGAAAGWGAAVLHLKDNILDLSERITKIESENSLVLSPTAKTSKLNEKSISELDRTVRDLISQNRLNSLLQDQLRQFRNDSREELSKEIKNIIQESKK